MKNQVSSIAENGTRLDSVVSLVGIEHTKNCWRVEILVGGVCLATGHFDTYYAADQWAMKMHDSYRVVHSVGSNTNGEL